MRYPLDDLTLYESPTQAYIDALFEGEVDEGRFGNAVKATALAGAVAFGSPRVRADVAQQQPTEQQSEIKQLSRTDTAKYNLRDFNVLNYRTKAEAWNACTARWADLNGKCTLTIINNTGSMQPVIYGEAVCLVEPVRYEDLQVGNVVVYHPYWMPKGKTAIHQIVSGDVAHGFKAKGIGNPTGDHALITADNLNGIVRYTYHWEDGNKPAPKINQVQSLARW